MDRSVENVSINIDEVAVDIQIKYHDKACRIEKNDIGTWVDLRSAEDVEMKAGEFKLISLGVSMKLPFGYEANFVPRSSTFKNFGILQTNGYSVIDTSYSGTNDIWRFPALAMRDTKICKGDRICQFRINRTMDCCGGINLIEADTLDDKDRGGFGSTGIK